MSTSPFVFEIGADITKFTKSIGEVEAELKKFKTALKTDTGAAIVETNKRIKELETSLVNLKKIGLDSTQSFGKASTNALTSLSLAIQDVSFGFIGIQNNLPGIVQGFGQMTANAKTGASIMSQLGTALVGPAGIYLAFSAVTAIVTKLSMEYGSLGEVMNAIFGKTNALSGKIKELSESYAEFNKQLKTSQDIVGEEKASTSAQITEVQTLSKIILDQTKSYNERNAALNRLKEINKDYFGNLDLEKTKFSTLTDAVTGYKDSLVQGAITKGFQEQVSKTNLELSKQQILLEKLQDAKDATRRGPIKISRVTGEIDTQAIKDAESAYNAQLKVVNELKKRKAELNKEVINSVQAQITLRAPVDAATAAFEKQKKAEKELAAAKKKIKLPKELDLEELSRKARYAANKLQEQADKNRIKYLQEQLKLEQQITKQTFAQADKDMKADAEAFTKVSFLNLEKVTKPLSELQKKLEEAKFLLNEVFFNPLQDAFMNLFETGKFAFKAFGDAVLKQIQQLVSKIIATGIISLIANLLFPGVGAAAGGASLFKKIGTDILGAIGLGGPGVANPSFGGVGPGSMGMSGQVNVVLRGSDLVGALNRTNATINRVG
jgi:hypothetical protein